ERAGQRGTDMEDAGVVDDDLHVIELVRDRRHSIGIGDVELDGHEAGVGDGGDVAYRGVDRRGASVQQRVSERLADPAVGTRDEGSAVFDVHCCLQLFGRVDDVQAVALAVRAVTASRMTPATTSGSDSNRKCEAPSTSVTVEPARSY